MSKTTKKHETKYGRVEVTVNLKFYDNKQATFIYTCYGKITRNEAKQRTLEHYRDRYIDSTIITIKKIRAFDPFF